MIKRNPVITCFSLAFVISWGLIVILAGPGNMPIDAELSQKLLPLLYTMMLVGPSASGLLLTGLVKGNLAISLGGCFVDHCTGNRPFKG